MHVSGLHTNLEQLEKWRDNIIHASGNTWVVNLSFFLENDSRWTLEELRHHHSQNIPNPKLHET